jgi:hypothetical protein
MKKSSPLPGPSTMLAFAVLALISTCPQSLLGGQQ